MIKFIPKRNGCWFVLIIWTDSCYQSPPDLLFLSFPISVFFFFLLSSTSFHTPKHTIKANQLSFLLSPISHILSWMNLPNTAS